MRKERREGTGHWWEERHYDEQDRLIRFENHLGEWGEYEYDDVRQVVKYTSVSGYRNVSKYRECPLNLTEDRWVGGRVQLDNRPRY